MTLPTVRFFRSTLLEAFGFSNTQLGDISLFTVIGYTPDVFFAPVAGRILDASPGAAGHQHYFIFLACFALTGILVVSWLIWLSRSKTYRSMSPDFVGTD